MAEKQTDYLRQLRDQVAKSFDEEELRALVFDLGLDWDELQGTRKTTRVQDLIIQLGRNGRLSELVDLLQEKRPHLSWPEPPPLEQQRQVGRELPLLAGDGEMTNTFPNRKSKHYVEEWRFGGVPQQLGATVSTYAELRPDILFRVTPKSDGRVRIGFTRQVDFTDPRDRIVAQGWAIVQSLLYGESMVHLFALNSKHWLYLEPVWYDVTMELKRQGWTMRKIAHELNMAVARQRELAAVARKQADTAINEQQTEHWVRAEFSTGITYVMAELRRCLLEIISQVDVKGVDQPTLKMQANGFRYNEKLGPHTFRQQFPSDVIYVDGVAQDFPGLVFEVTPIVEVYTKLIIRCDEPGLLEYYNRLVRHFEDFPTLVSFEKYPIDTTVAGQPELAVGDAKTAVSKQAQVTDTNSAEWRISERLTAEDITSAVAVAIAKSGLTSRYERRDDNVVSHIIFDGHTKIYSVIVSQANGYWRLYEELPENYKEFGESKRQSISRVVQAIKKEIVQASDLSDYRAGIPSLTWPNPPNTTRFGPDLAEKVIGSEESATDTQAVFVPKRPADLRRWKTTWKRIRSHVERGESVNELISLRQEKSSPETLEKIIRAGEAGLLS